MCSGDAGPSSAPEIAQGLPVAFALTGAKSDERETLLDLLAAEPGLVADRPGQTLIGDKNHFGRDFGQQLAEQGIQLLRPARKSGPERPGAPLFKPLRQVTESVNDPSRTDSTPDDTEGAHPSASSHASCSASSRSPPRSGTTTTPDNPSRVH
nr:hypothetical protein [Streptomyces brasiliensis]